MMKKFLATILICFIVLAFVACNRATGIVANEELSSTENQNRNNRESIGHEVELAYSKYAAIMDLISLQPRGAVDFHIVMRFDANFGEYISSNSTYGNMRMIVDGTNIWLATVMDFGEFGGINRKYLAMENFYITFMRIDTPGEEIFEFDIRTNDIEQETMAYFHYDDVISQMMMFNFPVLYQNDFIYAEVKEENGFTVTNVLLDNHAFIAFVIEHEFFEPVLDGIIIGDDIGMELGDFTMTIITDSTDIPIAIGMEMFMELEVQGEPATLDITIEYLFNAFDYDVVIDI